MSEEQTTELAEVTRRDGEQVAHELATSARPMSLKDGMALLPVEQQNEMLAEYDKRRNNFRRWLLEHMQEGVHYGVPPGCEVKMDDDGNILQWNRKANRYVAVSKKQWQSKPSLYKAGALMLSDLCKFQPTYKDDKGLWESLGSDKGTIVKRCELLNPGTKEVIGEGTGVAEVGEKGADKHTANAKAQKRALVDAIITALGLADLFTPGLEDMTPPPSPAPDADPEAPRAATRTQRQKVTGSAVFQTDEYQKLIAEWKARNPGQGSQHFIQWAIDATGGEYDLNKEVAWTLDIVTTCMEALHDHS